MEFHCIIFQRDVLQNGFGQHFALGNIFSFEKLLLLGFLQHCVRKHQTLNPAEGKGLGEATTAGWGRAQSGVGAFFFFFLIYSASSPANESLL